MQLAFPIDARMDKHGKRNVHGSFDMSISKEWMIDFHKKMVPHASPKKVNPAYVWKFDGLRPSSMT